MNLLLRGISAAMLLLAARTAACDEPAAADSSRVAAMQFHLRAVQKTGLLVPLYIYPADIHTNLAYNQVIRLKRRYADIPFWVIVNPASGPGQNSDANYTKAIDRLTGAGCIVLGYVPTGYGKVPEARVAEQLRQWRAFYPRTHGVFFDEMIYEDTDAGERHQTALNRLARNMGYWPTVANPGTDTPARYFRSEAADVIVIHESDVWPTEAKLHGDYFGGYSDFPPFSRACLIYSQPTLERDTVLMATKYTRWIYVTQDTYRSNDPEHPNPWDNLSIHLEELCRILSM